ncbi:MAG: UDP-N-acetylglucosamine pyrophosphorylase [Clostridia bacterium]|nr:UDP-N-acetylglucosamine pyrophosphorylase [Clostridia bacterium]
MNPCKIDHLYDLSHTLASDLLSRFDFPWEVLPHIKSFVLELGATLSPKEYDHPTEDVWIAKDARIAPSATVMGPAIIGKGTELRTGAFIRGSVLIGEGCVVGNSCELKNAILFDKVQTPHFNYIGDSILGYASHTGAGAVTSNVKSDKSPVTIATPCGRIETGLKKCGAFLGDFVEIGCNSVLNPGTVIGRSSNVYPLSSVRGFIPEKTIFKDKDHIVPKH